MSVKEGFVEFLDQTTIHGIKDAFLAANKQRKSLWAIVLLATVGLLAYQVSTVVLEYADEPTATSIEVGQMKHFPRLVFCFKNWASEKNTKKLGISFETFLFLSSFFPYSTATSEILENIYQKQDLVDQEVNSEDLIRRMNNSLDQLLPRMAFDPRDVIYKAEFDFDYQNRPKVRGILRLSGVCYELYSPAELPVTAVSSKSLAVYVYSQIVLAGFSNGKIAQDPLKWFSIGDDALGLYGGSSLLGTSIVSDYSVEISASILKQLKTARHNCRDYSEVERSHCVFQCKFQQLIPKNLCRFYFPGGPRLNLSEYCSWAKHETLWETWVDLNKAKECMGELCPQTCTKYTYSLKVTEQEFKDFYERPDNTSVFEFILKNPDSVNVIQEYKTYSLSSLLANIGGTVSLLCGASLLSLVQMCYFFCAYPGRKTQHNATTVKIGYRDSDNFQSAADNNAVCSESLQTTMLYPL